MKNDLDKLFEALREGSIAEAEHACRKLCMLPELTEAETFEILIALGKHKDPFKRRLAAKYLAIHPLASNALGALRQLLQDKNRYVVSMASESLGSLRRKDPALLDVYREDYPIAFIIDNQKREYFFCDDGEINARLTALFNEARHVFNVHRGEWKPHAKDAYAEQLAGEIKANPWLGRRILALKDRLVSMLVYRAYEMLETL